MEGPAVDLYKSITSKFPELFFIASGGITSLNDLEKLKGIGCRGAILGKAIYENKISLHDLHLFNLQ
jgi:phosphoribosylformimino-5-aminoimidazole carboxamide ribotide isomerase